MKKYSVDIVVVGAGGSGLAAAAAAAENGARVIVIDKLAPGGSTAMAKGFFAAESLFQKRALIDTPKDVAFKIAMAYNHLKVDGRILRAFIDRSGDTAGWLERMGVVIESIEALYPNQRPLTCHVLKGGGAHLIAVLRKFCLQEGVQIVKHTNARQLLNNDQGAVSGVLATTKGTEVVVEAAAVILATGGYGGNVTMLEKYCPVYREDMRCIGAPNMGDGLTMALAIGADTAGLGILHFTAPYFPGKAVFEFDGKRVSMPLAAVGFEPNTVWVNQKGERFADESWGGDHFESANTVIRQPGQKAFILLDASIVQAMEFQGLIVGQGKFKQRQRRGLAGLTTVLQSRELAGHVKMSSNWDGIAEWIGADASVLRRSIEEYNNDCLLGNDRLFAKERRYLQPLVTPPFYALKAGVIFLSTIGGIKIDHNMQVLHKNGFPIDGLYAVGVDAGGWTADTYCGKLSGNTLGFALNSGRIAGERAARQVLGALQPNT